MSEKLPTFIELPAFERMRESYLDDEAYRSLQVALIAEPKQGDVIIGTGGLRKTRFEDKRRKKGKRGGLRVIYYYQVSELEFLMFTLYSKGEMDDLTEKQKALFKERLKEEIIQRYPNEDRLKQEGDHNE
jgi:hypothetical protein